MSQTTLNKFIQDEISRLAELNTISSSTLEEFAQFVIENYKKKLPKIKPLKLNEIKEAVYKHFDVSTTTELKKLGAFRLATSGLDKVDLSKKSGWEAVYRKVIGILPGEDNETGYGCINGVDIFKYDMPWKTFGLDPKKATTEDIKASYRNLSKIYHPDAETGDAKIFDRLTTFYKSLTEKF